MLKRVLTGVAFAVITIACVLLQGWPLRLFITAAMLISMREMYHALQKSGADPKRWPGYMYCGFCLLFQVMEASGRLKLNAPMLALVSSTLIGMSAVIFQGKVDYSKINATIFPMLYPGIFYSLLMTAQDLPGSWLQHVVVLVLMFFTASVNDVFALFVGIRFGKHKLAPQISPKKSIEGSLGGLAAGMLFSMAAIAAAHGAAQLWPALGTTDAELPPMWVFALLGLLLSGMSQVGDLVASLIKRHCGIKDFGNLLPGHGGMMDRMDGILFCAGACWIVFELFML